MDDVQQNLFQVTRKMFIDKDTLLIMFRMCRIYLGWYSDHMGYSAVSQSDSLAQKVPVYGIASFLKPGL